MVDDKHLASRTEKVMFSTLRITIVGEGWARRLERASMSVPGYTLDTSFTFLVSNRSRTRERPAGFTIVHTSRRQSRPGNRSTKRRS